jgi:hypothetical protein
MPRLLQYPFPHGVKQFQFPFPENQALSLKDTGVTQPPRFVQNPLAYDHVSILCP